MLQERIARLKQSGGIGSLPQSAGPNSPLPAVDSKSKFDKFQKRFAAAHEKSAGESIQSIASIRSRRATVDKSTERDIEALQTKMREAESAGKLQLARLYQREIERRTGDKQVAVSPTSR
jgi:hypothetical protein